MIDLSPTKGITVDAVWSEATAGPGVLWGEFDRSAEAHGLTTLSRLRC